MIACCISYFVYWYVYRYIWKRFNMVIHRYPDIQWQPYIIELIFIKRSRELSWCLIIAKFLWHQTSVLCYVHFTKHDVFVSDCWEDVVLGVSVVLCYITHLDVIGSGQLGVCSLRLHYNRVCLCFHLDKKFQFHFNTILYLEYFLNFLYYRWTSHVTVWVEWHERCFWWCHKTKTVQVS